jgi:hypothetical protein
MKRKWSKFERALAITAVIGAASVVTAAPAQAFSFLTPWNGPVEVKFINWEQETPGTGNGNGIIDTVGEQLDGILKIKTISAANSSSTLLWFDGKDGEELTGTFSGYTAGNVAFNPFLLSLETDFTGGNMNLYLDNTPDFDATYPSAGVTDGILFLSAAGATGIHPIDNPLTVGFDESTATLHSTATALTSPFTGNGTGYLEITGGAYASLFGVDTFGPGRDLYLNSDFSAPGNDGWPVKSDDPVIGTVVPEPGTLLLLGSGIIGLGLMGRRRFKK